MAFAGRYKGMWRPSWWDGPPLPAALRARLKRAWQKVPPLTEQIGSLEAERRAGLRPSEERVMEPVRQ
jgi:hypothetical protein